MVGSVSMGVEVGRIQDGRRQRAGLGYKGWGKIMLFLT